MTEHHDYETRTLSGAEAFARANGPERDHGDWDRPRERPRFPWELAPDEREVEADGDPD